MSTVLAVPSLVRTFSSMASVVELRVIDPGRGAERAMDRAESVVREVAGTCTRFDPASPLSRANREPASFHLLPAVLASAIEEAAAAHRASDGLFDPRVYDTLIAWGYDETFEQVLARPVARDRGVTHAVSADTAPDHAPGRPGDLPPDLEQRTGGTVRPPWSPMVLPGGDRRVVRPGAALDLGGIAKGLAVRWAAAELAGSGAAALVDAGGDQMLLGAGPAGTGWRVGVEDPFGQDQTSGALDGASPPAESPIMVLELTDAGCATSSVRRRRWLAGGTSVHHLVDPRTSRPGGAGLASVTVVDRDPAWAEVWSKTLFLVGADRIEREAARRGLAAAWVHADGRLGSSAAMEPLVLWRAR